MSIALSYNALSQVGVGGIMSSAGPAITLFVNIPHEYDPQPKEFVSLSGARHADRLFERPRGEFALMKT